jgi:hypothetical protein
VSGRSQPSRSEVGRPTGLSPHIEERRASRFGFETIDRTAIAGRVTDAMQLRGVRLENAIVLRRVLGSNQSPDVAQSALRPREVGRDLGMIRAGLGVQSRSSTVNDG